MLNCTKPTLMCSFEWYYLNDYHNLAFFSWRLVIFIIIYLTIIKMTLFVIALIVFWFLNIHDIFWLLTLLMQENLEKCFERITLSLVRLLWNICVITHQTKCHWSQSFLVSWDWSHAFLYFYFILLPLDNHVYRRRH